MKTLLLIVIIVLITLPFYYLRRFINKKINDGVDNIFNKAEAAYRNKKHQQQGTQNLADRYANVPQQPNNQNNGNQPPQ